MYKSLLGIKQNARAKSLEHLKKKIERRTDWPGKKRDLQRRRRRPPSRLSPCAWKKLNVRSETQRFRTGKNWGIRQDGQADGKKAPSGGGCSSRRRLMLAREGKKREIPSPKSEDYSAPQNWGEPQKLASGGHASSSPRRSTKDGCSLKKSRGRAARDSEPDAVSKNQRPWNSSRNQAKRR